MALEIVPATGPLGQEVADRMREADRREVWAVGHHVPREAVARSIVCSAEAYCALIDGVPVACFGVAPVQGHPQVGSPWFLGATGAERQRRALVAGGREYVGRWLERYDLLFNTVDLRNIASIRWLVRLGFTLLEPIPLGPEQRLFVPFQMRAREAPHLKGDVPAGSASAVDQALSGPGRGTSTDER